MDGDGGGADQRRWLCGARHRPPDLEPCFSGLGVVAVAIEDGGAGAFSFPSSVPFLLGFHENFTRERPGLRPTDCFSMGPKEWTAWETSWPENGMQMGPFSGTATDGGVLSAAPSSPFQVSLCAESHSPNRSHRFGVHHFTWLCGMARFVVPMAGPSSLLPHLFLSLQSCDIVLATRPPPSPPQRYVPPHSLILYILYMCHISKLTVGD